MIYLSINLIVYTKQTEDEDLPEVFVKKFKSLTELLYNNYYKKTKTAYINKRRTKKILNPQTYAVCMNKSFTKCLRLETIVILLVTTEERLITNAIFNLRCRKPLILPVSSHNLQGYDYHLFIKQLAKIKEDLSCIPSTEEKYIPFSKKIKVREYKSKKTGEIFQYTLK